MNLPNKITVFRVCMIPVFLYCYLAPPFEWVRWLALAVFIIASLSDALDGHIARSRNLVTNFGKLMDPLADKLLVSAALVAMVETMALPSWVVAVLISREFFISGYRQLALEKGLVMAASNLAKIKTATQMVMILFLLIPPQDTLMEAPPLVVFKWVLVAASVIFSLASAAEYVYKNKIELQ